MSVSGLCFVLCLLPFASVHRLYSHGRCSRLLTFIVRTCRPQFGGVENTTAGQNIRRQDMPLTDMDICMYVYIYIYINMHIYTCMGQDPHNMKQYLSNT